MIVVNIAFIFKQKTAYEMRISDWSSDVSSSDLSGCPKTNAGRRHWMRDYGGARLGTARFQRFALARGAKKRFARCRCEQGRPRRAAHETREQRGVQGFRDLDVGGHIVARVSGRSEERRVGQEGVRRCRYR